MAKQKAGTIPAREHCRLKGTLSVLRWVSPEPPFRGMARDGSVRLGGATLINKNERFGFPFLEQELLWKPQGLN